MYKKIYPNRSTVRTEVFKTSYVGSNPASGANNLYSTTCKSGWVFSSKLNIMTEAEKIIIDLIDNRKINGAQALALIKELKSNPSSNWSGIFDGQRVRYDTDLNSNINCIRDNKTITRAY